MSITEFLIARIGEEEKAAAEAYDDLYDAESGGTEWTSGAYDHVMLGSPYARFIRSRSPEQAIQQCQVNRALVALGVEVGLPATLRLLALAWMDHPDYREEWKP